MTTEQLHTNGSWLDEQLRPPEPPPRRRVHGLRFPVIPSWPLLAQVGGSVAVLSGMYMWRGLAATLIVGGLAAVLLGMLREAGRI